MKNITDSGERLNSLVVSILLKDNSKYLDYLFPKFVEFEGEYDIDISYVFIENDSVDDTANKIKVFLEKRDGILIHPGGNENLHKIGRIRRIEKLRNLAIPYLISSNSKWSLILDSEIYFDIKVIERLFSKDPTLNKFGLLGVYGEEFIPNADGTGVSQGHYYDTFAFVDQSNILYWPNCIFETCRKCAAIALPSPREKVGDILEVNSAFGGLAILSIDALRKGVRWISHRHRELDMCEHIGLCAGLRNMCSLRIGIATDLRVFWNCTK